MNILLGICGSIAGYKAFELTRLLRNEGMDVKIILTKSALNFVTPLSGQNLSANEVYTDQFVLTQGIKHLTLTQWADLLVIAPATANIIGKAAAGIADDLLSTTVLSFSKPVLFVPAMDEGMWQNQMVRKNVASLKEHNYHFLEPGFGPLASGKIGKGRFPSLPLIYRKILTILEHRNSLKGWKFLVSGGRTEEDLDSVRIITNRSSGIMASEIIEAVMCRDGQVKGIFGETSIALPTGLELIRTRTAAKMLQGIRQHIKWCDCLIMAAAVGDYRPRSKGLTKIHGATMNLTLKKNPDLLETLTKDKGKRVYVGFSLEDTNPVARAREKMRNKHLDLIVLNPTEAIGSKNTSARIIGRDDKTEEFTKISKWEMANHILDRCLKLLDKTNRRRVQKE